MANKGANRVTQHVGVEILRDSVWKRFIYIYSRGQFFLILPYVEVSVFSMGVKLAPVFAPLLPRGEHTLKKTEASF
jgi:hypothetical protein